MQCADRVPSREGNSAQQTDRLSSVEQETESRNKTSSFNMAVRRGSVPNREAPESLRRSRNKAGQQVARETASSDGNAACTQSSLVIDQQQREQGSAFSELLSQKKLKGK